MLISSGLLALGFTFALLRTLFSSPGNLLSVRTLSFLTLYFGLIIFLVYGFGGLWKRKRYGYWLGLLFLAVVNVKNIYVVAPSIYGLIFRNSSEASSLIAGDKSLLILDVAVQTLMFVLMLGLFLKVLFGKRERMYFHNDVNEPDKALQPVAR
jgi:hypothetical protein